ncbi:MAG: Rha family transcriptional regulator [Lachnospiraceae bacterium]
MDLVMMRGKNAVCGSVDVAEHFGKRHDTIIRAVDNLLKSDEIKDFAPQNCGAKMFWKSSYESRGRQYPMYYMNRDGFSILVMGFTGKQAIEWKIKYIGAFNRMEQLLAQKQTEVYRDTRAYQKEIRKQEADAIKCLVEYAQDQGSRNADRYYLLLSKLADRTAGVEDREQATLEQLGILALAENIIARCIAAGTAGQMAYKDIYRECRHKLEQFREAACID